MEILFENKTKYSKKEYDIFIESYKKEYAVSDYAYIIFYIVFFGFCMILAFKEKEFLLGIALLIGLGIYLWYKVIRSNRLVEKTKKSKKVGGQFVNSYEFYKNYFKVENIDGKAQVLYFKLYRVVETRDHFYIYISRQYAFIVSKSGFTKGSTEDFSKFIKKKVFTKYKNRIN